MPDLQDARETTLHDYFEDTYGNPSNNPVNTGQMSPASIADTSILSMASINNDFTLRLDTGHIGQTYLSYYFTDNTTYISSTDDGNPGACTVQPGGGGDGGNTSVGAYPVNFVQSEENATNSGNLHFEYTWRSSTGNLADLNQCSVREVVTYPGPPGGAYTWNSPPYAPMSNPSIFATTYVTGDTGAANDNQGNPGFKKPYKSDSFSASQRYEYSCPSNGGTWMPLVTGLTIVRNVSQNDNSSWKYIITKSGSSSSLDPLP